VFAQALRLLLLLASDGSIAPWAGITPCPPAQVTYIAVMVRRMLYAMLDPSFIDDRDYYGATRAAALNEVPVPIFCLIGSRAVACLHPAQPAERLHLAARRQQAAGAGGRPAGAAV